jgi:HK97 family phage major capsid protein
MAIDTKEALDKKILEQDGEIAALKAKAEGSEKLHEEMEKLRDEVKDSRDKMADITSKNWVEKYSTQNTKEETLWKFGNYIKGMARHDKELLDKFGQGGMKLKPDQEKAWGHGDYAVQKADLGTPLYSDAATGSYVVPVEYSAEVMYVAKQASQLMGQVREIPMNAVTKYVPTQDSAASVSWNTAQSSAKSETTPTFSRATLTAYTGAMWAGVSDELLEDSLVPLAAYFRDIFGEAFGYEFDYQSTQSNASPFTGMLRAASNALVLGTGQVSFNSVGFDDLYEAIAKLTTVNKRANGKFIMHCTVFDILRKIKDANGNYIYQAPSGTQPGSLCGYPYIITDGMISNSSSAASTKFIVFGDPKQYLWGNRLGMEFKVFDQTAYALEWDEIMFRGRVRWGFTAANAGSFVAISTAAS